MEKLLLNDKGLQEEVSELKSLLSKELPLKPTVEQPKPLEAKDVERLIAQAEKRIIQAVAEMLNQVIRGQSPQTECPICHGMDPSCPHRSDRYRYENRREYEYMKSKMYMGKYNPFK